MIYIIAYIDYHISHHISHDISYDIYDISYMVRYVIWYILWYVIYNIIWSYDILSYHHIIITYIIYDICFISYIIYDLYHVIYMIFIISYIDYHICNGQRYSWTVLMSLPPTSVWLFVCLAVSGGSCSGRCKSGDNYDFRNFQRYASYFCSNNAKQWNCKLGNSPVGTGPRLLL